ncbi:MAG: glycoside hydrolase superfamily [Benjaminiella poitrasii]|nr:MAG: glycoside hydrolase superfamily [Benjaminiella poitrasii]
MKYDMDGEHDVDQNWIQQVRSDSNVKVLPRFQLRNWSGDDLRAFIANKQESQQLALEIDEQVKKYNFDGVVLECGFPAFFQIFIKELSTVLHQQGRQLIIVLPSILVEEHKKYMNDEIFASMAKYVDRFSLMTYDYSSHVLNGGPASPIEWMMDNIDYLTTAENRHQLLVGLNLYATSYLQTRSPEPLVMKTVLEKLVEQQELDDLVNEGNQEELNWDKESQEAWFVEKDEDGIKQGTIWLPTLRSIRNRLRMAEDYGVGVSLWEVGQGLDYFYDLF